jgi:hypothetical protein
MGCLSMSHLFSTDVFCKDSISQPHRTPTVASHYADAEAPEV